MKPLEPKGLWPQFAVERLRRFAEFNRNGKACAAEHRHHPLYRLLRVTEFLGSFCHLHLLSICLASRCLSDTTGSIALFLLKQHRCGYRLAARRARK